MISISVQEADFNHHQEYDFLRQQSINEGLCSGAIVTFTGLVREFDYGKGKSLSLEHYPGMTEKALSTIAEEALERWSINGVRIIHRTGKMMINEQIVFIGIASPHRKEAFAACEFIMDYLKTRAPFWKKAETEDKSYWIEAKTSDQNALDKWARHEQEKK